MSESIILDVNNGTPNLDAILSGITHIHASCIQHSNTIATFRAPLSYAKMSQWWHERYQETEKNLLKIWVELLPVSSRKSQLESPLESEDASRPIHLAGHGNEQFEVAGVVQLQLPVTETGPFRGEVVKLLVSPNHRKKGSARRLMTELEHFAIKAGRWNLALGTDVGNPTEIIYPKMGYTRIGVIPDHALKPFSDELVDEVLFCKDLRKGTLGPSENR